MHKRSEEKLTHLNTWSVIDVCSKTSNRKLTKLLIVRFALNGS